MVKVCHVGINHTALDVRMFKEAGSLAAAGYDVSVIGTGNAAATPIRLNNVDVVPIRTAKGVLHQSDGVQRQAKTIIAGYRAALRQRADIYHIHDPLSIPIGIWLAARGAKVIYDVHEFYDDWLRADADVSRTHQIVLYWLFHVAEPVLCRAAVGVIVVDEGMTRYDKYGAVTVHNFQPKDMFSPSKLPRDADAPVGVMIDGGFQESRCTLEVIQAVCEASRRVDVRLDAWGHFWGVDYERACGQYIRKRSLERLVEFHDPVSHSFMPEIVRRADIGVIPLRGVWNERARYPNKLSQFAGSAVPVVAAGGERLGDLVGEIHCGVRSGTTKESLAAAIVYLAENDGLRRRLGANGRAAVESWMNWEAEEIKLLEVYRGIVDATGI